MLQLLGRFFRWLVTPRPDYHAAPYPLDAEEWARVVADEEEERDQDALLRQAKEWLKI